MYLPPVLPSAKRKADGTWFVQLADWYKTWEYLWHIKHKEYIHGAEWQMWHVQGKCNSFLLAITSETRNLLEIRQEKQEDTNVPTASALA